MLIFSMNVVAQGIEFEKGSWANALEKAKAEDKLIFVDGYAVWCGPCKVMAKKIFPLPEVGDYFNKNFINVKMDMEKGEGLSFRKKYPISAYPTLYFINPDGNLVQSTRGAPRTAQALLDLAMQATKKFDRSVNYMKRYESGDRSYETMYNLVKTLNKSGKPSLKYANEYLRTQDNLNTKENLHFLFEALTQVDSRVFDEFAKHKESFTSYYADDFIHTWVEKAAMKTVSNAIEFDSPELLEEAKTKYAQLYPQNKNAFNSKADVTYATETNDSDLFLSASKSASLTVVEKKEIINQALNIFADNPKVIKQAEKWAKSIVSEEESAANYYLLAMTQVKSERVSQAIKSLEKCIELTDPEAREAKIYIEQLQKLKAG